MKHNEYCEHCGGSLKANTFNLSLVLCRVLAKMQKAGGYERPINVTMELDLKRGEYTNFNKLKYWDLVRRADDKERGGTWMITDQGMDFLMGEIELHDHVVVYRKQILRYEGAMVSIKDVTGGWWLKGDYIKRARPHTVYTEEA